VSETHRSVEWTYANHPAAHFILASSEKVLELQRIKAGQNDLVQAGFDALVRQVLFSFFGRHSQELHVGVRNTRTVGILGGGVTPFVPAAR
jgi:hypothetical protein